VLRTQAGVVLRILYAYHLDPRDPHVQSGRPFGILSEMERHGHEVDVLLTPPARFGRVSLPKAWSIVTGQRYGTERSRRNSRAYAGAVARHLASRPDTYDCLFSPNTYLFADLDHPIPKIACVDILIDDYIRTYLSGRRVAPFYEREANGNERAALAKLALLIVPSQAAERNAAEFYGMPKDRIVRLPFGGNLGVDLDDGEAEETIAARLSRAKIEFLFIGREWQRKNGRLVIDTCAALARRGVEVHAHLVGLKRPPEFRKEWSAFSTFYGRIDLRVPDGIARLRALAARSSFFFLPSRAEAFGLSFAEAAALALPLIGGDVGGIRDLVTPDNGLLVDPDHDPDILADAIVAIRGNRDRYRRMALAALADSRERLNWRSFWQASEPRIRMAISGASLGSALSAA